jgi:hypothetical protein
MGFIWLLTFNVGADLITEFSPRISPVAVCNEIAEGDITCCPLCSTDHRIFDPVVSFSTIFPSGDLISKLLIFCAVRDRKPSRKTRTDARNLFVIL